MSAHPAPGMWSLAEVKVSDDTPPCIEALKQLSDLANAIDKAETLLSDSAGNSRTSPAHATNDDRCRPVDTQEALSQTVELLTEVSARVDENEIVSSDTVLQVVREELGDQYESVMPRLSSRVKSTEPSMV